MTNVSSELLAAEEAKRERNWNPQLRWQVILATIAWAESQKTVRRNSRAACLAEQERMLKQHGGVSVNGGE